MSSNLNPDLLNWITAGGISAVVSLVTLLYTRTRGLREDRGYMKIKLDCHVEKSQSSSPSTNMIIAKTSVENTSRRDIMIQAAYLIVSKSEESFMYHYKDVNETIKEIVDKTEAKTRSEYYVRKSTNKHDKEHDDKLQNTKKRLKDLDDDLKKIRKNFEVLSNTYDSHKNDLYDVQKLLEEKEKERDAIREEFEIDKTHYKRGINRVNFCIEDICKNNPKYRVDKDSLYTVYSSDGFYIIFLPYYYHGDGNVALGSYEILQTANTIKKCFESNGCSITFIVRGRWRNNGDYYLSSWRRRWFHISQVISNFSAKLRGGKHRFYHGADRFVHDEVVFL